MGKGSRQRKARQANRASVQAQMQQPGIQKALHKEINNQLAQAHDRFFQDECAVILWTLHQCFGFGAKRLRKYYDTYRQSWEELKEYYEVSESDIPFVANEKLREIGVDLSEWDKEGASV